MSGTDTSPDGRASRAKMIRRRRLVFGIVGGALVLIAAIGTVWALASQGQTEPEPAQTEQPTQSPKPEPSPEPEPSSEPEPAPAPSYDVDSPDSLTVVVNKQRTLQPVEWEPTDLVYPEGIQNNNGQPLRAPASTALLEMHAAASADGLPLIIASAYRSYWNQDSLFERYAASDGVEAAETYSARPGHSEHQTGLAVDLTDGGGCTLEECFGETATGLWLRENAYRFGFILRYDDGEQPTVGYLYEPWHFRYVGVEVSTAMHEQGVRNLEDFVGLPAAPDYS